jgi:hypothetical protein
MRNRQIYPTGKNELNLALPLGMYDNHRKINKTKVSCLFLPIQTFLGPNPDPGLQKYDKLVPFGSG